MSIAARDLSLLDRVARGGRFLFPDSRSYDLDHRRMISCLSMYHKFYFSGDLSVSSLIPGPLLLARATRFAERQHDYAVAIPQCHTSQFQRCFILFTSQLWNSLPEEVIQIGISKVGLKYIF